MVLMAASRELTEAVLASRCVAIAYETVTSPSGGLPLLAPMSEVAGRLAPQVVAWALQRANGGRTVPQIFVGDTHVGGSDDLHALERAGKLDHLLAA